MSQDSTGSIILPPVSVLVGDPAGDSLENLNTNILANGVLCYVGSGVGQGEWQLQKEAVDAPNGTTIIAPTAGPGRWFLKLAAGTSSGGPAAPDRSIQFNNGGVFGGSAEFLYQEDNEAISKSVWRKVSESTLGFTGAAFREELTHQAVTQGTGVDTPLYTEEKWIAVVRAPSIAAVLLALPVVYNGRTPTNPAATLNQDVLIADLLVSMVMQGSETDFNRFICRWGYSSGVFDFAGTKEFAADTYLTVAASAPGGIPTISLSRTGTDAVTQYYLELSLKLLAIQH